MFQDSIEKTKKKPQALSGIELWCASTVKLGYNDHGYKNKILSTFWSQLITSLYGYTNFMVITSIFQVP